MKLKEKMKVGDIVKIEWDDANSNMEHLDIEDAIESELSPSVVIGKLVAQHKNRVILASIFFNPGEFEETTCVHVIPRSSVRKSRVLEAKKNG